jgi:uncharacterized membrane protein
VRSRRAGGDSGNARRPEPSDRPALRASWRAVSATSTRTHWPELDVVRGLAGIAMVFNHAAAKWLSAAELEHPFMAMAFLLGGYAPVIFFSTTGLGAGIQAEVQRARGGGHSFGFGRKVAILLVADALMWLSPTQWVGNDFLGFIALCMLVLEPLRSSRHGWVWAAAGVVLVTVLRYGVAPLVIASPEPGAEVGWAAFAGGLGSPPGFSYPLLPWLAYALFGFVVGVWTQRSGAIIVRRRALVAAGLLLVAVVGVVGLALYVQRGGNLARWGSVNRPFYLSGFVGLALCSGLALVIAVRPRLAGLLELRGISSLALVPVHYAVIAVVLAAVEPRTWSAALFGAAAIGCVVVSFMASRAWERITRWMKDRPYAWHVLMGLAALAVVAKLTISDPAWLTGAVVVGQLALCSLLLVASPKRGA